MGNRSDKKFKKQAGCGRRNRERGRITDGKVVDE